MKRVVNWWRVGLLCVLFQAIAALPVSAAGPYDGVWFTNQSCSDPDFSGTFVVSATENDNFGTYWDTTFNMVLFVLDSTTGEWNVDLGTRIGSTIQGVAFDSFGFSFDTFTVTANSPTSITGTAQSRDGVSCSLTGTRVF